MTTFNQGSDFQVKFQSKARFLIDESVGMEAARLIRDRGWNVCYVDDVALSERSDEEVFAFAWKEERILLTCDFDFLDDSRFPFNLNPGLVVLPRTTDSRRRMPSGIDDVLALIGPYYEAYRGYKIRIAENGVWTIRRFDTEKRVHHEICVKFGKTKASPAEEV